VDTLTKWLSYPLLLIVAAAAILCGMAVAAALGKWTGAVSAEAGAMPLATAATGATQVTSATAARLRCAECGVIESVRRIETVPAGNGPGMPGMSTVSNPDAKLPPVPMFSEITIRMSDRSLRVINDSRPADWRIGERVIVIAREHP